jgi:hypothetical protein
MTTTHDDNATTWRDLAEQLTAQQIEEIAESERNQLAAGYDNSVGFLNYARKMATENAAQIFLADVPSPREAIGDIDEWSEFGDGLFTRQYNVWRHPEQPVSVEGWQYSDGQTTYVEREIIDDRNDGITAEQCRHRAAALLEAADLLDRLSK